MQRRGMNVRKGLLRVILPLLRALPPRGRRAARWPGSAGPSMP